MSESEENEMGDILNEIKKSDQINKSTLLDDTLFDQSLFSQTPTRNKSPAPTIRKNLNTDNQLL